MPWTYVRPGAIRTRNRSENPHFFELDLAFGVSSAESAPFILDLRPPKDPAYAAWLNLHFSEAELLMPHVTDEVADPDLDGQDNWFEYIAQLNPKDRKSYLTIYYTTRERAFVRFGPISEGVSYDFQYTQDFDQWTTIEESRLTTDYGYLLVDVTGLPAETFHRVAVTPAAAEEQP